MPLSVTRRMTLGLAAAWFAVSVPAAAQDAPNLDVHFVPTPTEVVERLLDLAAVTKDDFVMDLGSGDGRIPITAATRHGASGMGIDLDPQRIKEARANLEKAGVGDRVSFVQQNLFETDLGKATVITMYLLPRLNIRLRPTLLELAPGTRLASHAFNMGDWTADRHDKVNGRDAYLWIVPAKVQGEWTVQDGDRKFTLDLAQRYQMVEGTARLGDTTLPLRETALRGARFTFSLDMPDGQTRRYVGRVEGDSIEASPEAGDASSTDWSATKS